MWHPNHTSFFIQSPFPFISFCSDGFLLTIFSWHAIINCALPVFSDPAIIFLLTSFTISCWIMRLIVRVQIPLRRNRISVSKPVVEMRAIRFLLERMCTSCCSFTISCTSPWLIGSPLPLAMAHRACSARSRGSSARDRSSCGLGASPRAGYSTPQRQHPYASSSRSSQG